jgi:hypothetical protein
VKRPPAPLNPFLPDLQERIDACLPDGHPAKETPRLTPLQKVAYESLLWFFDPQRARGSGRSYVMACVLIELAKRGYSVEVADVHMEPTDQRGAGFRRDRYMVDLILRIAAEHFPRDIFTFDFQRRRLEYRGRRPE